LGGFFNDTVPDCCAFYKGLALVSGVNIVTLALLFYFVPAAQLHLNLAAFLILVFIGVCLLLYYSGINAANSKSKAAFPNLISGSVFGKMILAIGILFVYKQSFEPANQWFVGVFLLTYLLYTGFEVWFRTKLAKQG
jgi:hypothetical protein